MKLSQTVYGLLVYKAVMDVAKQQKQAILTWIVIIAIIKIGNVVWGLISNKKLVSIHTILNKVTGFILFLLPLTFSFIEPIYSSAVVCFMATLSAINEVYYTRIGKEVF